VNLGIARAEVLKGILLGEKGNPQSIITDGVLSDSLYFQADTLIGGIDVIFKRVAPQSETSSNVDSSPDLTLYFPYAKTDFSHSEEIDKKIDNAITYLKAHPNQQVTLTGYTDNKGSDELNLKLSARRAQNVQDFFVRRGLSPEQFKIVSQGKANPQGNNDTQKGRQENRRVVLSF
jgi:outer membrane protein OmpA-like peptidoglycan-associated protein